MTITIRPAGLSDLDPLADLLLADAESRCALRPDLWKLDKAPRQRILNSVKAAMEADNPPFRQQWLVAEADRRIVGVTHSILLPVPPIYAGKFGPPGLIMEDCHIAADAPPDTRSLLFQAAAADLTKAGARILLASSVEGGEWEAEYARQGLKPLTMYFAKTGLSNASAFTDVRHALVKDVPAIVASSAVNRQILKDLHPLFWKPHDAADSRFGAWMTRSLTLNDRDMSVAETAGRVRGYAISQPATALHFPAPHDISNVGVIDDFFHEELVDARELQAGGIKSATLFEAAEAARGRRGNASVLVVCPAAWASKITLLKNAGYSNAITWFIKTPD
ncbi:MAG: hypothetical protein JJU15_12645 [Pararhodobacter sp.]|nr:hypothetical protein [Pararhodobacter sp.]